MILDEVQHAPALISYIQGIVDEHPERRFILSGSSQFAMLKKITQSLAGRTAIFELLPMSYPNYVKTYLERDVRDLLQIKDMMQFQTFLRLCAGRVGSLFNASELSNEVGVSANTIKSWLSVLQASYVITLLPPYFENSRKRLTKPPKLYFNDTGLACYLLSIESPQQLLHNKMRGHLFENFVVAESLKHRYNQGKESNLYFYRDINQNEVDLIFRHGENFQAIEIKSAQTYNVSFEKGLKVFESAFGQHVTGKAIVYCGELENTVADVKLLNYKHLELLLKEGSAH